MISLRNQKEFKMLVLTRRVGESLLIGEDTELKILFVGKNQVRVGIEAPQEIRILRKELVKETAKEAP